MLHNDCRTADAWHIACVGRPSESRAACPKDRGLSLRTCARERVRFSVAPAITLEYGRRFTHRSEPRSRNTEMMRERAREKRFENPARPMPQGDLAGKAAGCPLPAVPLCSAMRGLVVPVPFPFQSKSSASPRTRPRGNGSSGSHRIFSTIYKSPPRLENTRVVPRSSRKGSSPCNGFGSIQMRRGNSSPNVDANAEARVHVNIRTVPVDTERKQR